MTRQITEALHLQKLPPRVRETLDSWRLWVTILAIAVGGLAIWGFVNSQSIAQAQAKQARDDAAKTAQIQAQAQGAFQSCKQSRPVISALSIHVRGVNELAETLVQNSGAIVNATGSTDPQYATRLANLGRIQKAAVKIAAVKSFPVPTLAECAARRAAILKGN